MRATRIVFLFVLLAILLPSLAGQTNSREADVKAAVDAYLAKMPPTQLARSNAYFEGGCGAARQMFCRHTGRLAELVRISQFRAVILTLLN